MVSTDAFASTAQSGSNAQQSGVRHDFRCVAPQLPVNRSNPGGPPTPAVRVHLVDSLDGTIATLDAVTTGGGGVLLDDATLQIEADGSIEFSGDLNNGEIVHIFGGRSLASTLTTHPTLCIARFSPSSPPVVLLYRYSFRLGLWGIETFAPLTSGSPTKAKMVDTPLSFQLITEKGMPVIEATNSVWDVAGLGVTAMPIGLLTVTDGRFVNVTTRHPAVVAKDAARQWTTYAASLRPGRVHALTSLAAWAGDECELGHRALVRATLTRREADGQLSSPFAPEKQGLVHGLLDACRPAKLAQWPSARPSSS